MVNFSIYKKGKLMKKIVLLLLLLILCAFFTGCDLEKTVNKTINGILGLESVEDEYILEPYLKSEEYIDEEGFQDYVDFCKYYYNAEDDKLFINNKKYKKIEDKEDIESITVLVTIYPSWATSHPEKYDFEIDKIKDGDYYAIVDKESTHNSYYLFYYDVTNHILYYLHSSA